MKQIIEIPLPPDRPVDSHKGTFGKVLVIGGSVGFSGAPSLAAMGVLRGGAGLARVAVPASIQPVVAALEGCYTTIALADCDGQMDSKAVSEIAAHLPDNDVVAFGPGAGDGRGVRDAAMSLVGCDGLKLVIDADGLNALSNLRGPGGWVAKRKAQCILTPHPGEMKRLWKSVFREAMPEDRVECAGRLAKETETIVVLKGARTVVTDGDNFYVNETGNSGMATAGSGDVLTGVIAALIGQGMDMLDAAIFGVHLHGAAADIVAYHMGPYSLIATDILDALGEAFAQILQQD
ncbi:MAG: NAD(P)H-hydrate dehydratase [Planctomycetota bacterium]